MVLTFSIRRISFLKTGFDESVSAFQFATTKYRVLPTGGRVDLIGTVSETEGTDTGPHGGNRAGDTTTSVELDGSVEDLIGRRSRGQFQILIGER